MPKRTVMVWRRELLPLSETFIRNQFDSMTRWEPVLVGARRTDSPIARDTDLLLHEAPSIADRLYDRLTGYRRLGALLPSRPHLIHAHFLFDALAILPFARRGGIPLIVTGHGYDVNCWANATDKPPIIRPVVAQWRRLRIRQLFDYAQNIVAVSGFLRGSLIRLGAPPDKVSVRYIGVPIAPLQRETQENPEQENREGILFVGRLYEAKGVDDLLRAVARMSLGVGETPVTIVGAGPMREELEKLARKLRVNARFTGGLAAEQIRPLYRAARVFCAPSKTTASGVAESFGMVFLEAAAACLPAVSYRVGGIAEAVEDGVTGTLVAEGDINGLARALERYLGDPCLALETGQRARQRVRDRFDIRQCTEGLQELYDRAVARALMSPRRGRLEALRSGRF